MQKEYYFNCPDCGSREHFTEPEDKDSESLLDFFMFGFLLSLIIYWFDWAGQVQCGKCRAIFKKPPPPISREAVFAKRLLKTALWAWVLAALLMSAGGERFLPSFEFIEGVIVNHPRVILYLLGILGVGVPITCLVKVISARRNARLELAVNYEVDVSKWSSRKQ